MTTTETPGDEWATPDWITDPYYDRYDFKLDAAANPMNSVVPRERLKGDHAHPRRGHHGAGIGVLLHRLWHERGALRSS